MLSLLTPPACSRTARDAILRHASGATCWHVLMFFRFSSLPHYDDAAL